MGTLVKTLTIQQEAVITLRNTPPGKQKWI